MIDITDKRHVPSMPEIAKYIDNPLFTVLCRALDAQYHARSSVMYSGDNVLLGWNVRFYKGSRTLCRLYPKPGSFSVLVVVGRKEKARVEQLLPGMSAGTRAVYEGTREGMGQRWLLFDLKEQDAQYVDVCTFIRIRAESK